MRKTIVILLTLTLFFSFVFQSEANEKKRLLIVRPDSPGVTQTVSREVIQKKRESYIKAREEMRERISQYSSMFERVEADNPKAVDIVLDSSYVYWQEDPESGSLYMTGLCHNAGTKTALSIEVEVEFYDIDQNYLGSAYNYVYGGSNVRIQLEGIDICPNVLRPGEYGFFSVWPYVSYSEAHYYSTNIYYYSCSLPAPNTRLSIDENVYYQDYEESLNVFGFVNNSSSTYVAYYTTVCLAVFNSDKTKVLDVGVGYVDGSLYEGYNSAIYPLKIEPFNVLFGFASSSEISGYYHSGFMWAEALATLPEEKDPPFGSFDTPVSNSTVCSSIPVTGWALDESGVESVKIYREQNDQLVYIGDATFVEGARPDIAAANPQYPLNTRAGWGYMMLTNFLPNSGNGTFVLHAIATDKVGKTTTLGKKTIICDNANAVKPFGAIDRPDQGGSVSDSRFVNWGWVLTPQPNSIPKDGSTINVFVDGVDIGHPTYNIYRSDIANLFPGYANSNGAVGYFYLDSTSYEYGMHTIQWTARDSAGNSDGIGSRYFSIDFPTVDSEMQTKMIKSPSMIPDIRQISQLPEDYSLPIRVKRGFKGDIQAQEVFPGENDMNRVVIKELERIVVYLSHPFSNGCTYDGYMVVGRQLKPLPIGSTLDPGRGVFYWQPGPGFIGEYRFVFIEKRQDRDMSRKNIIVKIVPRFE